MKFIYTSLLLCLFSIGLFGQNYTRDAGIRFGNGLVGTYRQFYKEDKAVELFAGYTNNGMKFGGIRENFIPALTQYSENFRFCYGYGVHTGFTYTNKHSVLYREYRYDWFFSPLFGMNGLAGLEYTFPEVPILVSLEINPYFEFSLNRIFFMQMLDVSFSLKYRF
ncbi:MAG: hypothetical protein JXA77_16900 [Bacteroidales bacterium]|nr:hypothetical protein [Bacteroidales bacterium]MBN2819380.1 hypothetical protein [Bacteroidales bacterium]